MTELDRVVRPLGIVCVKAMDYVWSGRYFPAVFRIVAHAERLGWRIEDRMEFLTNPSRQPGGRAQRHARRNHSTLLVFRTGRIGGAR
jgi:hypothetical protein